MADKHFEGDLSGKLIVSGGMGGMGGANLWQLHSMALSSSASTSTLSE
jgi:urocanate hydratase